jgi:hypothetical protein
MLSFETVKVVTTAAATPVGEGRIWVLSGRYGASALSGLLLTIAKASMQPVMGKCADWVHDTIWGGALDVTWNTEEGFLMIWQLLLLLLLLLVVLLVAVVGLTSVLVVM